MSGGFVFGPKALMKLAEAMSTMSVAWVNGRGACWHPRAMAPCSGDVTEAERACRTMQAFIEDVERFYGK